MMTPVPNVSDRGEHYLLRLFVSGLSPRSAEAIAGIKTLCDELLAGRYDLEIVDLYQQAGSAWGEQVIASPTLVRQHPLPIRRMVGNLSNRGRVMRGLGLAAQL